MENSTAVELEIRTVQEEVAAGDFRRAGMLLNLKAKLDTLKAKVEVGSCERNKVLFGGACGVGKKYILRQLVARELSMLRTNVEHVEFCELV